ncbi:Aldo-keto reductase family 4 member C10 [Acorus calamus]|uniref:Aldo-keto reductase family 4 member C10 n=1 Tax=Acorus calamus TaxID=4465 RepID=A0AAV9F4R4_ACOCL|nr:Aldo-keto reductase family 4 member C10 [Acorus calamus]
MKYFNLNTGGKIPSVGLGAYKAWSEMVENTIFTAIKAGYRHIDCAQLYGNEKEV